MITNRKEFKILIAPNAFKESLSAPDVAESIHNGLSRVIPPDHLLKLPVADGGDGSLDVLIRNLGLRSIPIETIDPVGRTIAAPLAFSEEKEAFIEMATTTGLHFLKDNEKDAGHCHSGGTGRLIKKAIQRGNFVINLFVGGTASMDMGTGILKALGFKFLDRAGNEVPPGGINLGKIKEILLPERQGNEGHEKVRFRIFCDVNNPLLGPQGAVKVFGPQKDNGQTDMEDLEQGFSSFARLLKEKTGKDVSCFKGGGAAGGTPAGLSAFFKSELLEGAEKILDFCHFDEYLEKADIVITGEGKLDDQSLSGKAPMIIARRVHEKKKKIIFIGGSVPDNIDNKAYKYFDAVFSIIPGPVELAESISNSRRWIERTAYLVAKMLYL
ncbi:MAG: glycerate kinase [Bacteroidota bacterium]